MLIETERRSESASSFSADSYAAFFNKASDTGDPELGLNLAKMAFTLSEGDNIPSYVLFMNDGVKLTTELRSR